MGVALTLCFSLSVQFSHSLCESVAKGDSMFADGVRCESLISHCEVDPTWSHPCTILGRVSRAVSQKHLLVLHLMQSINRKVVVDHIRERDKNKKKLKQANRSNTRESVKYIERSREAILEKENIVLMRDRWHAG